MLNFSFSLTTHPTNPQQVVVRDDTTNWGMDGNPLRSQCALVVGTELLSPWQAASWEPAMGLTGYNPIAFTDAKGLPITLTRPSDGVLRVIVAVVPIIADDDIFALVEGTAYCTTLGQVLVRGTQEPGLDIDLIPSTILGEGAAEQIPNVLAYESEYHLWNQGLQDALARLNLRYLGLPYAQQAPLVNLYDRAALIYDGTDLLFQQRRVLDCAAVLEGGRKLLVTGGQTPDAYAPLLTGYLPFTSVS